MQKTSTHYREENKVGQSFMGPKRSTVDFIKQFARAYSYNRMVPAGLGGFVAN